MADTFADVEENFDNTQILNFLARSKAILHGYYPYADDSDLIVVMSSKTLAQIKKNNAQILGFDNMPKKSKVLGMKVKTDDEMPYGKAFIYVNSTIL